MFRFCKQQLGWAVIAVYVQLHRLTRDYERTTANSEAMIYWATIIIMTRRLARYENGQPPTPHGQGAEEPTSHRRPPGGETEGSSRSRAACE
jgi:hypothetical protein